MSDQTPSATEQHTAATQPSSDLSGMPLSHAEIITQPARGANDMPWDPCDLSAPEQPEAAA